MPKLAHSSGSLETACQFCPYNPRTTNPNAVRCSRAVTHCCRCVGVNFFDKIKSSKINGPFNFNIRRNRTRISIPEQFFFHFNRLHLNNRANFFPRMSKTCLFIIFIFYQLFSVAVVMPVARHPPHRSGSYLEFGIGLHTA
jgi:hypothetical protein